MTDESRNRLLDLQERSRLAHEHVRLHPHPGVDYQVHWEVAWLLALADLGWLDDEELLAERKIIPISARCRRWHALPDGTRFYPQGKPEYTPPNRNGDSFRLEFVTEEVMGASIGHTSALNRTWFDISHVNRPADRLAFQHRTPAEQEEAQNRAKQRRPGTFRVPDIRKEIPDL